LKGAFAAALALGAMVTAPTAAAELFAITKHGDHAPNGCTKPDCTLREAVRAANAHTGRDRIILPTTGTYVLLRTGTDDNALRGDLDITGPVRIFHAGGGHATIDARGIDRVFEIFPGAATELEHLRITGGDHPTSQEGNGGAIHTSANLTLDHSIVTGNHARGPDGSGGAIQALGGKLSVLDSQITDNLAAGDSGALDVGNHGFTIKNSTLSGNRASFAGVGYFYGDGESVIGASTFSKNRSTGETGTIYYSESAGSLFVSRSTFSENAAATEGGGFSARNGDVKMVNVTIAGNRAGAEGGGIWILSPVTLNAVTVARNVSDSDEAGGEQGSGLYLAAPGIPVKVHNTIVALNRVGSGQRNDCAGDPFMSLGHNLLSTLGPTATCQGFDETSDLVNAHPRLDDLAKNGGKTKTIALRKGSPAIGHADPATAPARDQRGVLRKDPDTGAFERR
jgi:hypothetical protein